MECEPMLTTASLPAVLRELADRFESAGLPDTRVRVEINATDNCTSREELAGWLAVMRDPVQLHGSGAHRWLSNPYGRDIVIIRHFEPGLLGGKEVITYTDDEAGLAKLREEFAAAGKVGA